MHVVRAVDVIRTVNAADRHNPDRRLAMLHHSHLHGARLAAHQDRFARRGARGGEIEIVERIAGRMVERNVQRVEVVPFVFELRAVDNFKSEPANDLSELANGLRERMQPAQMDRRAG